MAQPDLHLPDARRRLDVADYLTIDPRYGTLVDLDRLVTQAHHRGLRVVLDFVPNHTSDLHPWFVESRTSRAAVRRDWYLWADPAPGGAPPNDWWNHFDGGPAWTLDEATGQYYLHLFSPHQPDLNWRNPAVESAMTQVLRFWLDRGIDGFRVDVPSHLLKDAALRDEPPGPRWPDSWHPGVRTDDLPEVHDVLRRLRAVLDEYDGGGRVFIGELWLPSDRLVAYYGEGREFHVPLNQQLIGTPWTATQVRRTVQDYEAALPADAWPNWVLGNHDRARVASRLGLAQARVATMALLTLRAHRSSTMATSSVCPMLPSRATWPPTRKGHPGSCRAAIRRAPRCRGTRARTPASARPRRSPGYPPTTRTAPPAS